MEPGPYRYRSHSFISSKGSNPMDKSLKNAFLFLGGTILLTWLLYFPIPLLGWSPYTFPGVILLFFGGSVPSWLGVIMVFATYDKAQRKEYFQRIYQVKRIKPVWWAALILLFPAVMAAAAVLSMACGGAAPEMANLKAILANPIVWFPLIGMSFLSGPFSEELGWRGFALDPLLKRFGFAKSGLLLGLIWGVWHLPLFFMPQTWHGQVGFVFSGFWSFMLLSVGLTYVMSWVYQNTGRSILAMMLMHLSSNFSAQLMEKTDDTFNVTRILMVLAIGVGIAVYMVVKKKNKMEKHGIAIQQ